MARTVKNVVYYSIGEIAPRVIGFFLLPIYTRYLSPTEYGIISYISTIVMFFFVFGCLSLNSYTLRYYFLKNKEENKRMFGTIYLTIFFINLLLLAISFLVFPGVIDRYQIQVPWNPFFKIALIVNFLDSFSILPFVVYRVKEDAQNYFLLGFSKTLLMVLMTIYMLVYKHRGLEGYYYAQLIVYLPYTFIYLNIIRKHSIFCFDKSVLKEGFKYALPLVPGSVSYLLLSISDRLILERNVEMAEIGIYNMAVTLSYTLNIIIQGGFRTLEPEMYKRYGQSSYFETLDKIKGLFFYIVYVGGFGICMFSREFFTLMTDSEYHSGFIYVPLLVGGVVMTSQNKIYSTVLLGDEKSRTVGAIIILGAIVSVVINIALIPKYGTFVAACSAAISMLVMNVAYFLKMTYPNKSMTKEILVLFILFFVPYLYYHFLPGVSFGHFLLEVVAFTFFAFIAFKSYGLNMDIVKQFLMHKG